MPASEAAVHNLRHHFADMEQQRDTASFGMWIFLVTEIMFFGGMFCAYLVYRYSYYNAFVDGSLHMNIMLGTLNTLVLLTSSVTMVLAVRAAKLNQRKLTVIFLLLTIVLGLGFLAIKGIEYHDHWVANEFPGPTFHFEGRDPRHTEIFFSLYFAMTGIHALHMVIGVGLLSFLVVQAARGAYSSEYHNPVEMSGLYWHFVDMVWLYLFPLLYLISHHHIA